MNINPDLLNGIPREEVSKASFLLLTRLQEMSPQTQLAAPCALFLLICEHFKADPADIFRMATNTLAYDKDQGSEQHFGAIRAYIENEL